MPFVRDYPGKRYQKGRTIWILLKRETVSGSGNQQRQSTEGITRKVRLCCTLYRWCSWSESISTTRDARSTGLPSPTKGRRAAGLTTTHKVSPQTRTYPPLRLLQPLLLFTCLLSRCSKDTYHMVSHKCQPSSKDHAHHTDRGGDYRGDTSPQHFGWGTQR